MQNIEKMCEEYFNIVYKYLFCITQDEEISKDLAQDTFYIAIKDINKFREECPINLWLCKIAKNLWYKYLRQEYKKKSINIEELDITDQANIEESFLDKEEKLTIYKYMKKLNDKERKVISLRVSAELSFKEIGDILGKNETWARVSFYRGKEKLKNLMREDNYNERR